MAQTDVFAPRQAVSDAVVRLTARDDFRQYTTSDIEKAWGLQCSFDIYGCNAEIIRDADKIKQFVYQLCELIDMKRFGECQVVNFGEDERVAGFSMVQLIETSLISAHFANQSNTVYLDVFSCKPYNPEVVKDFAIFYFQGLYCTIHVNLRE